MWEAPQGAESEKNGERIGESYLVFHGGSYFRARAVRPEVPQSGGSLPYF